MKFSNSKSGPSSQSGQAMIEYTLMLIISVGLVLMVMYKIFQPLQGFVKNYMGDYIGCILETGELPAMGGESTFADDEGCNHTFEPGTLKAGRPYKAAGAAGAGKEGNKEGKGSNSGGGSGGGGAYSGPANRGFGNRGTPSADTQVANAKVTEIAVNGGTSSGFFSGKSGGWTGQPKKETSVFLSGLSEEEKKKIEKKKTEGTARVISSEGVATVAKKSIVKPPEPKVVDMAEDEPMTFGNFIRILFIVCIVLAIVIFIGGQVLQMSKNSD